jgi:chromosome segregation ATPase
MAVSSIDLTDDLLADNQRLIQRVRELESQGESSDQLVSDFRKSRERERQLTDTLRERTLERDSALATLAEQKKSHDLDKERWVEEHKAALTKALDEQEKSLQIQFQGERKILQEELESTRKRAEKAEYQVVLLNQRISKLGESSPAPPPDPGPSSSQFNALQDELESTRKRAEKADSQIVLLNQRISELEQLGSGSSSDEIKEYQRTIEEQKFDIGELKAQLRQAKKDLRFNSRG